MTLDTMDRRLLAVLQKRGRISNADLAEAVNLSPSACHRRVQRLETDGYIKKFIDETNKSNTCWHVEIIPNAKALPE